MLIDRKLKHMNLIPGLRSVKGLLKNDLV